MALNVLRQSISFIIGGILVWVIILIVPVARTDWNALSKSDHAQSVTIAPSVVTPLIHYQGRLLEPTTGQPKTDGAYPISFGLYNSSTGGVVLWSETKSVNVSKGIFAVLLGESNPFALSIFNGQELWLGVTVGTDPELTPRQRLAHVAYALYAENANLVSGQPASAFAPVVHTHFGQTWTGQNNPLLLNGAFAAAPLIIHNNGSGDGLFVDATGENGLDVRNSSQYATIYAESTGQANAVYAQNNNQYASIYAHNTGSGNGIGIDAETGNAVNAHNTSTFAAVYGKNSGAGAGGWFTSYVGNDILVAQEEVTTGSFDTRFRVSLNGEVYADGSFHPGGADFAEMLPAASGLEPGDVLVIGPQGTLIRSFTPNASNVAGVYSTKPGFVGGWSGEDSATTADGGKDAANTNHMANGSEDVQATDVSTNETNAAAVLKTAPANPYTLAYRQQGKAPLAVIGVVPVKVSTENGLIQPGDLLTTATTPGYAMKATPVDLGGVPIYRPGTIIGKALAPLSQSTGVIKVLVMLQ